MEKHEAIQLMRQHGVTVEMDADSPQKIVHKLGICLQTELECVPCTEPEQTTSQSPVTSHQERLWQA